MDARSEPEWSEEIDQADWIAHRLTGFAKIVTSIVPAGFEAYARVLHPVEVPHRGNGKLVRWGQVATWSGIPLHSGTQFHSIALPPTPPEGEPPWRGQGPREGSLYAADADRVAVLLREETTTPEQCWFCVWDGYGWANRIRFTSNGKPGERLPDPIPASVRDGRRVRLPHRGYFLYRGPVEAATALLHIADSEQTPNLWWPQDHAWCVAIELDLPWTYVGGSVQMIGRVLGDDRIEATAAAPDDPPNRIENWLRHLVEVAVDELIEHRRATIRTSRGTLEAFLELPGRFRTGELRTRTFGINGESGGSGTTPLRTSDDQQLQSTISFQLTRAVIQLAACA
jgi:hypothetical protein